MAIDWDLREIGPAKPLLPLTLNFPAMTYSSGVLTGAAAALLACGTAAGAWWAFVAKPSESAKSTPPPIPAAVSKTFKEDAAATVTLTADAEARLAIKTGTVERKAAPRKRVYGGEAIVPPGRAVIVSAPLAGTIRAAQAAPEALALFPGQPVKKGQLIYQFLPLLDPVGRANLTASRVEADGQVQSAGESLKGASIALQRAKNLLAGMAGRQRDVDEAQTLAEGAKKALEAATARRDLLNKVVGDLETGTSSPIPIDSPADGVMRTISALPGQTVPAGAPLFEVVDLSRIWIRVPIYVGDLGEIDPAASAAVGPLTGRAGDPTKSAAPVSAPPAANSTAGTVDVYYEMDNRDTRYRPGERVGATLGLRGPVQSLTVPWAAVVFDVHGGAWVYEKTADRTYARRRVVVRYVVGDSAVIDSGPPPGTTVVTAGTAELFGTEAGFSK